MFPADDQGNQVFPGRPIRRVVSLVPSLTESVAATAPGLLVGATDWCTQPPDLHVVRVRGTKNPDVAAVIALQPDLVLANAEENRDQDLADLRAAGLAVWVTAPRTLDEAFASLTSMLHACELPLPDWLGRAERAWTVTRDAGQDCRTSTCVRAHLAPTVDVAWQRDLRR